MNKAIVGHMDTDDFEAMLEAFIEHRSGDDDRLPDQTFFELLAKRQKTAEPVEVHVAWLDTGPVVTAPPDAPLTIEGHHIRFNDGHELILRFDLDKLETVPA